MEYPENEDWKKRNSKSVVGLKTINIKVQG